jgi:hypothetical protein
VNEQIKELIEQAGFEEKDGHISIQGVYMFNTTRMEKFAELVVRECLSIANKEHKLALEFEWDNDDTATSIKDSIKKHFGVEE